MKNMLLAGLFISLKAFAQQPAYFMFAEEQFRGVQVYDVIQDKQLNYWFATSNGLYYYDYHTFEKAECDKAKGNSIFRLLINNEGTIYCHNLNNQIFQIKDKTCTVFYELQTTEGRADISLSIADDGNLIIGAKQLIVLDKTGKKLLQYPLTSHFVGSAYVTQNNGIQFYLNGSDSIVVYRKGVFSKQKLRFLSGKLQSQSVLKFYDYNLSSYALDLNTKEHYSYNPSKLELKLQPNNSLLNINESTRIYEAGNDLWVAGTLPGATLISSNVPASGNQVYYSDYFISDVMKDNEGNTLLSTFDKGILVVPDTKVPDVIHNFKDDPVTALYSDSTTELMIGTSKGNLIHYTNKKLITVNTKGKRSVKSICGHPENNFIIFDDGYIRAYNKQNQCITDITDASLKDAAFAGNVLYLGTNRGIIKVTENKDHSFAVHSLKDMGYRIYSIEYNPADSCLYASTAIGLYSVSLNGILKKILIGTEPVFPNHLYYNNGVIYASTKKSGILILKNNSITKTIHLRINEQEEIPEKIIIYQNTIVARSSNGIFQFNMDGKLLKSMHSDFGFSSNSISDFSFYQNQLWISHTRGIQSIDLKYLNTASQKPSIRLDHILVNDRAAYWQQATLLNSDQRKVQFIFSSPTLKNRENIRYHYKLEGYDVKWNTGGNKSDQITYSALAPGDYTFYVKAENHGIFSEPVSCSFTVLSPFYARWWFTSIVVILFLAVVYATYRWQLNLQRKKSQQINELNASKLIAIQSQMNPHFIFNSLNSIQDLILKGNVEHSYSYITVFSDLVRRTLNYSEKDFINFEDEIKLLELYLSLEKLRFKKELTYVIDTGNIADIILPPLLIQPFVENSLIHGLLHKEGKKNLKITFELKETLICIIEDNGIGREKSKIIRLRQRKEHESFSGKAIRNRFEILSSVFKGDFGYVYQDLYENNEAVGTRVILTIPVKHKF